jgi:myosin protein heavy chain
MLRHTQPRYITDHMFPELQSQRDNISRLREENRKLRSDYDELQLRYDDEVYSSGGWGKDRERMEMKIADFTKAYEASTAAQTEQQSQIAALHSQVRELHSVLDDAEADRALLQKARRALQAELETIKLDHVDSSKLSTDQEFQRLQLKKQDLERSLEEQEDRVVNAYDRMKRAETYANECQIELGRIRVENSELEKLNVSEDVIGWSSRILTPELQAYLEKQIKELNVRIVDLETKSYASTPRSATARRVDNRIEELAHQLRSNGDKKSPRSPDKTKLQLAETERQRQKLDEERKAFEEQISSLRKGMDKMVLRFLFHKQYLKSSHSKLKKLNYKLPSDEQNGRRLTTNKKP